MNEIIFGQLKALSAMQTKAYDDEIGGIKRAATIRRVMDILEAHIEPDEPANTEPDSPKGQGIHALVREQNGIEGTLNGMSLADVGVAE